MHLGNDELKNKSFICMWFVASCDFKVCGELWAHSYFYKSCFSEVYKICTIYIYICICMYIFFALKHHTIFSAGFTILCHNKPKSILYLSLLFFQLKLCFALQRDYTVNRAKTFPRMIKPWNVPSVYYSAKITLGQLLSEINDYE